MERTLQVVATLAIVATVRPALRTRDVLSKTTLVAAWWWGASAVALWAIAWLASEIFRVAREGLADQLWFAAAVLMVSPFAAALGARRPVARIWSWFIVLPLSIVLFLPAATGWTRDLRPMPLHLEAPMLAGYGLVLVMGVANYLGTRFGLSAILTAAACLIVVIPLSSAATRLPLRPTTARSIATIALCFAVLLCAAQSRPRTRPRRFPLDGIWIDFRDLFGLVWARRIQDRWNAAAVGGNWPLRLHLDGFAPADPQRPIELSPQESAQAEESLRWLLRRFVDPEWMDERKAEG